MELNKNILLIGILFLVLPNVSALIISEIMYNPQGTDSDREWIEIYNDEANNINLTDWKFVTDGSDHGLNVPPQNGGQGSMIISPNEYFIVAKNGLKFLEDYPSYTGTLIDSSWTDLTNSMEHNLKLKDFNQTIVHELTYNPSSEEGNSLQLCSSSWMATSPTPGNTNTCQVQTSQNQTQENQTQTNTSQTNNQTEESANISTSENNTSNNVVKTEPKLSSTGNTIKENEVIVLNSLNTKDINNEESAKKSDKSNYAKYILTAFVFLLALLFLLKGKIFKKEYKNEFKK